MYSPDRPPARVRAAIEGVARHLGSTDRIQQDTSGDRSGQFGKPCQHAGRLLGRGQSAKAPPEFLSVKPVGAG